MNQPIEITNNKLTEKLIEIMEPVKDSKLKLLNELNKTLCLESVETSKTKVSVPFDTQPTTLNKLEKSESKIKDIVPVDVPKTLNPFNPELNKFEFKKPELKDWKQFQKPRPISSNNPN